jgi:hypothetical protein
MSLAKEDRFTKKVSQVSLVDLNLGVDTIERICLKVQTQSRFDSTTLESSFKIVNNGTLDIWYNAYNPVDSYFSIEVTLEVDPSLNDWRKKQFLYQTLSAR